MCSLLLYRCALIVGWLHFSNDGFVAILVLEALVSRVVNSLDNVAPSQRLNKHVYGSRNRLRREKIRDNPILELIASGSTTGSDKAFHRDVSMETRGSGELSGHFFGDGHWQVDVTYRVHQYVDGPHRIV